MTFKNNIGTASIALLLLCSCTKEQIGGNNKPADGAPADIGVQTRAIAGQDETGAESIYLTTHFVSVGRVGQVDVRRQSLISGSTVVMQVNSGVRDVLSVVNATQSVVTQLNAATDKSGVMGVIYELGEALPVAPFVMSAMAESQNLQQTSDAPMVLPVSLIRLVARLDLTVEFDALSDNFKPGGKYEGWSITLQSVKFSHLPTETPLFPKTMTYNSYKETLAIAMSMIPDDKEPRSWRAANKFYLSENLFPDPENIDKSTWVELYCKATPPAGYTDTEIDMTYKIAIGNHRTDKRNFTISRNGLYTLKLKLIGLDPADRVFIHSEVAPWSDQSIDHKEMMGYPGDIQLINFQFEGIVAKWTEDARDIDKIGLPWDGSSGGGGEGGGPDIDNGPWVPELPPSEDLGEGWN